MIYHFKGPSKYINSNDIIDAETIFDGIISTKKKIEDVEKNQMELGSKLGSGRVGGNKTDKQLSEIENREEVIQFYNNYFKIVYNATYNKKNGKGFKVLTAK